MEVCEQFPPMVEVSDDHEVACHLYPDREEVSD
jgi:hypothetical protein